MEVSRRQRIDLLLDELENIGLAHHTTDSIVAALVINDVGAARKLLHTVDFYADTIEHRTKNTPANAPCIHEWVINAADNGGPWCIKCGRSKDL